MYSPRDFALLTGSSSREESSFGQEILAQSYSTATPTVEKFDKNEFFPHGIPHSLGEHEGKKMLKTSLNSQRLSVKI